MKLSPAFLMLAILAGCGDSGSGGGGAPDPLRSSNGGDPAGDAPPVTDPGDPNPAPIPNEEPSAPPVPVPLKTRTYASSDSDFPNPERGMYHWVDLVEDRDFSNLPAAGNTLGFASVSLKAFRYGPISASFLDKLSKGFAAARTWGIKVVLRFKYSDGPSDPDATKARILEHIQQLTPLVRANADVIAVLQAGFIGAWGEWHSSSNGLENPGDQGEILNALLDMLPSARAVQVRALRNKQSLLGMEALSSSEAFSGSDRARVGHHNDAFLGGETDQHTYDRPVEPQKEYLAREGRFVPVGGECNTYRPPYTDGPNAIAEMRRLHFSFLSNSYKRTVLDAWIAQGAMPDIRKQLGYRIVLKQATWPESVRPGGELSLKVLLENRGFAAPYNARPVYVVLSGASTWNAARVSVDPRWWASGAATEFSVRLRVPASLPAGSYTLSLWLPDGASSLRDRKQYAIRFANQDVWNGAGLNVLTSSFLIDSHAAGPADPGAASFVEIR